MNLGQEKTNFYIYHNTVHSPLCQYNVMKSVNYLTEIFNVIAIFSGPCNTMHVMYIQTLITGVVQNDGKKFKKRNSASWMEI